MTKPRNFRAGHSHLVVHATQNEKLIFEEKPVAEVAIAELKRLSIREGLPVLAYCFLKSRVLLLFGPLEDPTAISAFMKLLTHHISDACHRHYRSRGPLWRERFQVWPVQSGRAEQAVMRYIDRLPVREECVRSVNAYLYSSYAQRMNRDADESWLSCPSILLERSLAYEDCLKEYCDFVKAGPDVGDIQMIEAAMLHEDRTIGERWHSAAPRSSPDRVADRPFDSDFGGRTEE